MEAKTVPREVLLLSGMNLVWENLGKVSYWIGIVDWVGLGKELIKRRAQLKPGKNQELGGMV